MRGDRIAKKLSREKIEALKCEHKTQIAVAKAAGVSRCTIMRLVKRYAIDWPRSNLLHGNSEWQALGE